MYKLILIAASLLFGCRESTQSSNGARAGLGETTGSHKGVRTELYFGGTSLLQPKWVVFLESAVSPVFPGFTIIDGVGSWKGHQMPAKIMIIFHSGSSADEEHIEQIRSQFLSQFGHKSVLRADVESTYAF